MYQCLRPYECETRLASVFRGNPLICGALDVS